MAEAFKIGQPCRILLFNDDLADDAAAAPGLDRHILELGKRRVYDPYLYHRRVSSGFSNQKFRLRQLDHRIAALDLLGVADPYGGQKYLRFIGS